MRVPQLWFFRRRLDSLFLFNIILWVGLDLDPEAAPSFGPPRSIYGMLRDFLSALAEPSLRIFRFIR